MKATPPPASPRADSARRSFTAVMAAEVRRQHLAARSARRTPVTPAPAQGRRFDRTG